MNITQIVNINIVRGYNKSQATSLAWAEYFEQKMAKVEYAYQGRVDGTVRIDTWCHDCKMGGQYLPDTTRNFIEMHKGHNTRTLKVK